MKEAFTQYLARNPSVDAIFVGTRRTDPHGGKLSPDGFDMTDGGWPRFMRVHPVIEWHYRAIWAVRLPLSLTLSSPKPLSLHSFCHQSLTTSAGGNTVPEIYEDPILRAL